MLDLYNIIHITVALICTVNAVIFKLLLTLNLKRDLAKNNNNNITTLIISVRAKVLRDPLVQYSPGLN